MLDKDHFSRNLQWGLLIALIVFITGILISDTLRKRADEAFFAANAPSRSVANDLQKAFEGWVATTPDLSLTTPGEAALVWRGKRSRIFKIDHYPAHTNEYIFRWNSSNHIPDHWRIHAMTENGRFFTVDAIWNYNSKRVDFSKPQPTARLKFIEWAINEGLADELKAAGIEVNPA